MMAVYPVADRILHLALFVTGAVSVAVIGLAVLERVLHEPAPDERPALRPWHLMVAVGTTAVIGLAERLYHAFS
jgi:hypothetical protein